MLDLPQLERRVVCFQSCGTLPFMKSDSSLRPRRLQSDLHKALKAVQESLPPGPRHCLIINQDGSIQHLTKDKHELAEELSIPIRDMRVVDPLVGVLCVLDADQRMLLTDLCI